MSRKSALYNLLGVDGPVSPDEYPDTITLPEKVHARTLSAVEGTAADGRERSIHFNYELKRWSGGLAMKGTKLEEVSEGKQRARINRAHLALAIFLPPHMHVHTHPQLTEEMAEEIVDETVTGLSAEGLEVTPEIKAYVEEATERVGRLFTSLPSGGDVHSALWGPLSSVGQMVASEGGAFLWVSKDSRSATNIYGRVPRLLNNKQKQIAEKSRAHINEVNADIEVALPHPSELDEEPLDLGPLRDSLVMSRVQALDPDYVCYFSENLETPTLTKVQNEAGEL